MQITDVTIYPVDGDGNKLLAYASILIDGVLCVCDLKIVNGVPPFIAMPARRYMDHCPECRQKNPLTARYCNWCGVGLDGYFACDLCGDARRCADKVCPVCDDVGKIHLYSDVIYPISRTARDHFTDAIMSAYHEKCRYERPQSSEKAIHP